MRDVFAPLQSTDFAFLVQLLESQVNLSDGARLQAALTAYEADPEPATRRALEDVLEHEIRYAGSAELAFLARSLTGRPGGVPFREVVQDVARKLKVKPAALGTDRELLEDLVERYATQQFAELTPEAQREMLVSLGVEREKAAAFVKTSAGVFALPVLIEAFNAVVVQGLIKQVIFGTIARIVGQQLSRQLFGLLARGLPWWVSWIGPAAWTASLSWAVVDLQGPAYRKTIPVVLYLGLCSLRGEEVGSQEEG